MVNMQWNLPTSCAVWRLTLCYKTCNCLLTMLIDLMHNDVVMNARNFDLSYLSPESFRNSSPQFFGRLLTKEQNSLSTSELVTSLCISTSIVSITCYLKVCLNFFIGWSLLTTFQYKWLPVLTLNIFNHI